MKKYVVILFLFAVSSVVSSCTSASAKLSEDGIKIIINHEVKYSNKGTRSEGRSGYLKINGVAVPDCFNIIVADGKVYTFSFRNTMWGDDGYFPAEHQSPDMAYPYVNKKISDSDIARGWSEVTGRYLNVPAHWIFVKWETGSAALLPDKIDILVKTKSLKTLSRNTLFSEKTFKQ